ncbi:hypothetical protein BA896_023250 [Janthinobacterium lividum]|uniref:Uncharacterized protein n=1 Tax=Janthinobacterium lividum TaxID=29581 RepID=A0A1E8PMN8_9BURK|nr:hypothetical protein BA896_023470 [Janthinobacterium lividum]OFJ47579.1 hypothetical protein BA896_023250 [Janthinobacterium lividum]
MGIGKTFIANPQPTETVEPAQGASDYPAPFARALARCDATAQFMITRKIFPRQSCLEHEQNAGQGGSIVPVHQSNAHAGRARFFE